MWNTHSKHNIFIFHFREGSKNIIPVMVVSHMGVLGNMFGSGLQICDSYGILGWLIYSFYDTIIMEDSFFFLPNLSLPYKYLNALLYIGIQKKKLASLFSTNVKEIMLVLDCSCGSHLDNIRCNVFS